MSDVARETSSRGTHSRAPYQRDWRTWTLYPWRLANLQSRNRHKADRKVYDHAYYLAHKAEITARNRQYDRKRREAERTRREQEREDRARAIFARNGWTWENA